MNWYKKTGMVVILVAVASCCIVSVPANSQVVKPGKKETAKTIGAKIVELLASGRIKTVKFNNAVVTNVVVESDELISAIYGDEVWYCNLSRVLLLKVEKDTLFIFTQ